MRRTGPPQRRKPLEGGGQLARKPLSRALPILDAHPPRKRPTAAQRAARRDPEALTWDEVREIALERDEHRCVGCGSAGPLDVHHRRRKGAGGSRLLDYVANALVLCGPGNIAGCHGRAHRFSNSEAAALGWCVPQGEDPLWWPVTYPAALGGGRWLLDDAGTRTRVD